MASTALQAFVFSSPTGRNAMKRYTFFSIRWMRPNRLWTSWHRLLQGCRVFGKEWDEVIIFLPIYVFLGRYLWLYGFSIAGTYLHRSSVFASRRPVKQNTVNPSRMIQTQRDIENFVYFILSNLSFSFLAYSLKKSVTLG